MLPACSTAPYTSFREQKDRINTSPKIRATPTRQNVAGSASHPRRYRVPALRQGSTASIRAVSGLQMQVADYLLVG